MRINFTLQACSDFQAQRLADASSAWTGVTENRVRMTSCLEGRRNGTGVCEALLLRRCDLALSSRGTHCEAPGRMVNLMERVVKC